jgi:hypothetical protein
MPSYVLRNFAYLDEQMINDALSALEGAIYEKATVKQTSESAKSLSAGVSAPVVDVQGKKGSNTITEVTRDESVTPASKFQKIYKFLENEEAFQYYDTIKPEYWDSFDRGDLLELEVSISLSSLSTFMNAIRKVKGLMEIVKGIGAPINEPDKKTLDMLDGLEQLEEMESKRGIPIKMKPLNSQDYTFISYLDQDSLKMPDERLTGEFTVFCKVQRKFKEGESLDLFDPLMALKYMQKMSRQKGAAKMKSRMPPNLRDTVKAPAAIVMPLAIYR